jgi:AcrR family transcriptional regulator
LPRTTRRSPDKPGSLTPNQERRRARILEATRDLVTKHGYDGTIMRDVAALADVSATTLYNLYNTKDELLLEALRERITDSTTRAVQESSGPGYEYLFAHLRSVCKETRKTPAYVAAIAQALFRASAGDPLTEVLLAGLRENTHTSLAAMRDRCELREEIDLDELSMALAASFWSVFLLWDKGLLKVAELERAQLKGYLSILIPATQGPAHKDLTERYGEINGCG